MYLNVLTFELLFALFTFTYLCLFIYIFMVIMLMNMSRRHLTIMCGDKIINNFAPHVIVQESKLVAERGKLTFFP